MNKGIWILVLIPVVIILLFVLLSSSKVTEVEELREEPMKESNLPQSKDDSLALKKYSVVMKTTEGDIKIELNSDQTLNTVNNFVDLAKKDFYNDTIFHRVMRDFMIQGGDPRGDGTGDPGYKFDDEPFEGEYTRGTIAMANSGPNTNGSQFFIMHKDYALPKNYVIFGKVTEGMDVVDKIAEAEVTAGLSGELSKPVEPVSIVSIDVLEIE